MCNGDSESTTKHVDLRLPWGVYIPPTQHDRVTSTNGESCESQDRSEQSKLNDGGYVRIVDEKGKFFPCGYSRKVRHPPEYTVGKKRTVSEIQVFTDRESFNETKSDNESMSNLLEKKMMIEERLHPEEALFLHMRGLLRVESLPSKETLTEEPRIHATMSTQDLFSDMLPECNISCAVYLAYAYLRDQGYHLIRYSENRTKLLLMVKNAHNHHTKAPETIEEGIVIAENHVFEKSMNETVEKVYSSNVESHCNDNQAIDQNSTTHERCVSSERYIKNKHALKLKTQLGDNVALAPPPTLLFLGNKSEQSDVRLAYCAYNPNTHFKRTNPGLPDFGVVVLPYHSCSEKGPTFDEIFSLLSLCKFTDPLTMNEDLDVSRFPLRIVTVADSGAVIVFGVTEGCVPHVNKKLSS